jgi:hypothetical protein
MTPSGFSLSKNRFQALFIGHIDVVDGDLFARDLLDPGNRLRRAV